MKKIQALLLAVIICIGLCDVVFSMAPDASPMWDNIMQITNNITFNGTDGHARASVLGKSGTSSISGTLTVYRQSGSNWVYVTSTSGTSSTIRLNLGCDFTAVSGSYYKSVFEVTVTINGSEETDSRTSYETCP